MTDLEPLLQRLGLQQYYDSFVAEGFETWETVLDIQESDLEALNVRLGHRRKLQRAIAEYRGISNDRPLGLQPQDTHGHGGSRLEPASLHASYSKDANQSGPVEQKRKYRRHPKADERAPEKPPSAYVLFSNKIREEVKSDNLSFTEIARLVGERWQKLDPAQKEFFEAHAASLKEAYNVQLAEYKKTESYKEYNQYLADFKAKHDPSSETKRPKLEQHTSSSFSTASGGEIPEPAHPSSGHVRGNSIESASTASLIGGTSTLHLATSTTPTACRESPPHYTPQDRRLLGQSSDQSSLSEESAGTRTDQADTVSRTPNVSIGMLPVGTPPSSATSSRPQRLELGHSHLTQQWPQRQSAYSYPVSATSGPSPSATPSGIPGVEQWRDRSTNSIEARSFYIGQPTSPIPISQLVDHEPGSTASQRKLPPLRQPTGTPKFTGFSPSSTSAPADPYRPQTETIALRHAGRHQPGRSETEAADILAAIAERQQHFDERKTPRHRPDPR